MKVELHDSQHTVCDPVRTECVRRDETGLLDDILELEIHQQSRSTRTALRR